MLLNILTIALPLIGLLSFAIFYVLNDRAKKTAQKKYSRLSLNFLYLAVLSGVFMAMVYILRIVVLLSTGH